MKKSSRALVRAGLRRTLLVALLAGGAAWGASPSNSAESHQDEDTQPSKAQDEHPWEGRFARVSGRIIEHDGSPATGLRVELLALNRDLDWNVEHRALGDERLVVGRTRTDDEGRFELGRTRPSSLHALSIDGGGVRSTARILDQSLEYGAVTDIGEIQLPRVGVVTGSVVDELGDPVAGARVRLGPLPELYAGSGLLDFRADCRLAFTLMGGVGVIGYDALIAELVARAPLPTVFTGEDGSFTHRGVPVGMVSGGVDAKGYLSTVVSTFELGDNDYFVGEIELLTGRDVEVTVLDAARQPVRDAQVFVGTGSPAWPVSVLQPAVVMKEPGAYRARGIAYEGKLFAFARRSDQFEWTLAEPGDADSELQVLLPPTAPLRLEVRDQGGEALGDVEFRLRPESFTGWPGPMLPLELPFGASRPWFELPQTDDGRYVFDDLPLGSWAIEARRTGFAPKRISVDHIADADSSTKVVLEEGEVQTIQLSHWGRGNVPVGVYVVALRRESAAFEPLSSAWTSEKGRVSLGPLLEVAVPGGGVGSPDTRASVFVSLEHPDFGISHWRLWPDDHKDRPERELEVMSTASWVEGRVHWGGGTPSRQYMLTLDLIEPAVFQGMLPRLAVTTADGEFRVGSVDDGRYVVMLTERFLGGDVLGLLSGPGRGDTIARATIDVGAAVNGVTIPVELDFNLSADGAALPGWFEGRVVENGQPLAGATLVFDGRSETAVKTDADGRYRSESFPADRRTMIVLYRDAAPAAAPLGEGGLYRTHAYPRSGAATPENIRLDIRSIVIEVKGLESGEPIAGARVECNPPNRLAGQFTNADGRLDTSLFVMSERLDLVVGAPGYRFRKISRSLLDPDKALLFAIDLPDEIVVSGRLLLDPEDRLERVQVEIVGRGARAGDEFELTVSSLDASEYAFTERRLLAGDYRAILERQDGTRAVAEFVVPKGGIDALEIDFRKER